MKEKPLKLQKDGTIVNVSNISDEELIKTIETRLKDESDCNYENEDSPEKIAEIRNIRREAKFSVLLSIIVEIILFVYCFRLLIIPSTFSERIRIISIFILIPPILKDILTVLIKSRHKEGYQELSYQELSEIASINSLDALFYQADELMSIYAIRYIYNEFIDTKDFDDFDDIGDRVKKRKFEDFVDSIFTDNLR